MFDFDNDGKVKLEEFEYFMRSFGDNENSYMDESKMQLMMECCKPLDDHGNINIETFVSNVTYCWQLTSKSHL